MAYGLKAFSCDPLSVLTPCGLQSQGGIVHYKSPAVCIRCMVFPTCNPRSVYWHLFFHMHLLEQLTWATNGLCPTADDPCSKLSSAINTLCKILTLVNVTPLSVRCSQDVITRSMTVGSRYSSRSGWGKSWAKSTESSSVRILRRICTPVMRSRMLKGGNLALTPFCHHTWKGASCTSGFLVSLAQQTISCCVWWIDIHRRSQTLCHLDSSIGLKLGVFRLFP